MGNHAGRIAYEFTYQTDLDPYVADATTFRCIDDRFWKAFKHYMRSRGLARLTPINAAGGGAFFTIGPFLEQFPDIENFVRLQLEVGVVHHKASRVMLFTHHDCLFFKKFLGAAEDKTAELCMHRTEHQKAAALIRQWYPEISVETFYIDGHGIVRTTQ